MILINKNYYKFTGKQRRFLNMPVSSTPKPSAPPMELVLKTEEIIAYYGKDLLHISKDNPRIGPNYSYEEFVKDHIDNYCICYGGGKICTRNQKLCS